MTTEVSNLLEELTKKILSRTSLEENYQQAWNTPGQDRYEYFLRDQIDKTDAEMLELKKSIMSLIPEKIAEEVFLAAQEFAQHTTENPEADGGYWIGKIENDISEFSQEYACNALLTKIILETKKADEAIVKKIEALLSEN